MSQIKYNYTTGTLKMKTGNNFGWFEQWKTFYFVLEGYYLFKHMSITETNPISSFHIKEAKVVDFDQFSGKANSFAIFLSNGKTLSFIAENNFDKQRWMAAIEYTNIKTSLTSIQESLLDACVSADYDGIIVSLNEKACQLFGYEKEEVIGKNVKILMEQNKQVSHDKYINQYKETGKRKMIGQPRKVIGKHANGQEFPVEISLGEIPPQQGGDVRFIAIFRAIKKEEVEPNPDSKEFAIISKPQDPVTASEFTKVLIDTTIKDYMRQVELTLKEEILDKEVHKKVKEILQENGVKLKNGVQSCFVDLKSKMEQFLEKEAIMKKEISELYEKFEQVKKLSQELKNPQPEKIEEKVQEKKIVTKTEIEKWKLSDFSVSSTLGTGTFGRVKLVQHKETGEFYAMKILKKRKLIQMKQVLHVRSEKILQETLNFCPFTVSLYKSFQDEHAIYLILEYVPGGELLTWITLYKKFQENMCKFFAAEILLTLEAMHKNNIVFRDLKPENVLLDEYGHVKIGDFGFAKLVVDKTWTTCGTPEYLAPEIILGTGHDKMVDWYSFGILLFEMLTGYPPFHDDDRFKLFESIVKGKISFPDFLSKSAKDLIKRLTIRDKAKRLGYLGVNEIKDHPWFKGINWESISKKQTKSPINIKLTEKGSTKYFMKYKDSIIESETPLSKDQNELFKDF